MPAADELRRVPLVVALALICVAVAVELGAAAFLRGAGDTAAAGRHLSESAAFQRVVDSFPPDQRQAVSDNLTSTVQDAARQDKPPGYGIPYLALVDGILAYSLALMVLSLVLNPNLLAKLQGVVTLVLSFFLALGSIVLILLTLVKLLIMVALFFAAPFGTIAYLAIWGDFPKATAAVILGILIALKIAATICLPLAQQRFLKLKSLILLIATSFLATIIVAFLQGIVPFPLVSITDALAAIIVGILALIWAVVILIGSINAVIQAVATT
jgi:hypothetical protein